MLRTAALLVALLGVTALAPQGAAAQDVVAEARTRYAEADFEGAVAMLRAALHGDGLTRAQVGDALATIAAASFALGRQEDVHAALAQLAVIDRAHVFGGDVPPEIREGFAEARASAHPVRAHLDVTATDGGHEVLASAEPTAAGIVREVRVACDGAGGARVASGATPSVLVAASAHCVAEVQGLGGLVVARAETDVGTEAVRPPPSGTPAAAGGDGFPWLWVGIGAAAAVVVLIVVIAVAATSGPEQIRPIPMVHF